MFALKKILPAIVSVALSTSGILGCASIKFRDDGFQNKKQNYIVKYSNPEQATFINDNWKVDNYKYSGDRPDHSKRKRGHKYRGIVYYDWNEDGTTERTTEYFTDLKLVHKKTNATIWITTKGLTPKHYETDLNLFLKNFAGSLAGEMSTANVGDVYGHLIVETRKFATKIEDKKGRKFGPHEAIEATITRSNLNQVEVNRDHVDSKLRIVITRIDGTSKVADPFRFNQPKEAPGKVLMIVGYNSVSGILWYRFARFRRISEQYSVRAC